VTGSVNEDEAFVFGQGMGFLKRAFAGVEVEEGGVETGW